MADERYDDPRIYFAAERTYLSWIRTSLALMGFGFVVARFSLFLREFAATQGTAFIRAGQYSPLVGTLMIAGGVILLGASTWRHLHVIRELKRGSDSYRNPSILGIVLAAILGAAGVALAIHVLMIE